MGMGPLPLDSAASAVESATALDAGAGVSAAVAAVAVAVAPSAAGSYAVLQCGEDSEYVRQKYSGYFAVFRALLEEDGERWRVYKAVRGELPTDAEAAGFDGFVISGSCADAHGDEPWILDLVALIRRLHAAGKRILGFCFGHQTPEMHGKVDCILKLMQAGANPAVAEGTSPKPPTERRGPIRRRAIAVSSQTIMASVVASRQSLALVALVIAVFVNGAAAGSDKSLNITNHCSYTVWPGIISGAAALNGGFELAPGKSRAMPVPSGWSGLVWGRTLCSTDAATGKFTCVTGDCGSSKEDCAGGGPAPPVTLGEFTLDVSGGKDLYDVSLVNGFNVPVLVAPQCAAPGGNGSCTPTGCVVDINGACPAELRVKSEAAAGAGVVACKSACQAFGSPQYCCTGEYGNPDTCKPSPYSEFFENACPRAVSYAYDDGAASVFTCDATDTIYAITFCPSASAARTSVKSSAISPNSQPPGNGAPLINRTVPYTGSNQPGATASTPWRIVLLVGVLTLLAAVLGVLAQVLGLINHCFKQNQQEGADTDGEL